MSELVVSSLENIKMDGQCVCVCTNMHIDFQANNGMSILKHHVLSARVLKQKSLLTERLKTGLNRALSVIIHNLRDRKGA